MTGRAGSIGAFLGAHDFGEARMALLAQDASFRRYLRATGGPRPAVLMDAPPEHEDVGPFLRLRAVLEAAGLSVPALLAADPAAGLLLLEDFGDTLYPAALTDGTQETLYDAATDALAALQAIPPPAFLPLWNGPVMAEKTAETFLDWWWPAMFGAPADADLRTACLAALRAMLAPLAAQPLCLTHRDYFAGNLFYLADRPAPRDVGIIDFQDAALSSPAYDLVSLVQDARRDLPEALAARQIRRLLAARPELDPAAFDAAFAICGAQRHLRVAALWVRLARRDGKPGYLQHGPRCWAMLDRSLAHPATAPLATFMDAHVPRPYRRNPDA